MPKTSEFQAFNSGSIYSTRRLLDIDFFFFFVRKLLAQLSFLKFYYIMGDLVIFRIAGIGCAKGSQVLFYVLNLFSIFFSSFVLDFSTSLNYLSWLFRSLGKRIGNSLYKGFHVEILRLSLIKFHQPRMVLCH